MIVLDSNIRQAAEYLISHLENFERKSVLRRGLTEAAKLFANRGRMNLASRIGRNIKHPSRSTGELLRSITTAYRASRRKGRTGMAVAGFRYERGKAGYHAHLVDLGTGPRYTESGAYRGVMPANYFWWDAREDEERNAQEVMYEAIRSAVEEINARKYDTLGR